MVGIVSMGFYLPYYRLDKKKIFDAFGWYDPSQIKNARGKLAVMNFDEDSITMSVAAGFNCVENDTDKNDIDALYFATTTPPYRETSNASIIAAALSLDENIRTSDFTDSLLSGTNAMLLAGDSVKSGSVKNVLVCAADNRLGKPSGNLEYLFGNAAASVLIGNEHVIAEIADSFSISKNFIDYRRTSDDKYVRTWEERWIKNEGYVKTIQEAVHGILRKGKLNLSDFYKVIYYCPDMRTFKVIGKKLNLKPEQMEDPIFNTVGNTGVTHSFLMLTNALKKAKPNDKILLIGYGNGADGIILNVTDEIEKKREQFNLENVSSRKRELDNYEQLATFRGKADVEKGIRGEVASSSLSVLWRERNAILRLHGSRCKKCGTPFYPPQRVCANPKCRVIDEMEDYIFANKKGKIFTFTADRLAFSLNPPVIYGIIDFDGGGRYWFDLTDCVPDELYVGMPVKMTFRRKFFDKSRGLYGYFWKATPDTDNGGNNV